MTINHTTLDKSFFQSFRVESSDTTAPLQRLFPPISQSNINKFFYFQIMIIGTPDDAVSNSECSQRPRENEFRIEERTLESEADKVTS